MIHFERSPWHVEYRVATWRHWVVEFATGIACMLPVVLLWWVILVVTN